MVQGSSVFPEWQVDLPDLQVAIVSPVSPLLFLAEFYLPVRVKAEQAVEIFEES